MNQNGFEPGAPVSFEELNRIERVKRREAIEAQGKPAPTPTPDLKPTPRKRKTADTDTDA